MAGSLEGIKVIDLTQGIAGPAATMVLADNGADVVKVEPHGGDPYRDVLAGYTVWNRSKRSVSLDLNSEEGHASLLAMLRWADVLVESFSPAQATRLRLTHDALKDSYPHLVHCSISSYGYDHPNRERSSVDGLVMAAMGVPWGQVGHRPGPIFHHFPVASYGTAFNVLLAISSALRVRLHTGRGQWIDTSIHDGGALLTSINWQWMEDPPPAFAHRMGNPMPYRPWQYESEDGLWFHRMQTQKGNIKVILQLLGYDPPEDAGTIAYMEPEERQKIEQMEIDGFKKKPRDEWIKILREHDVPVEPIQPTEDALLGEQAKANGAVADMRHPEYGGMTQFGLGFRLNKTPGEVRSVFANPGAHTTEVLDEAHATERRPLSNARHPISPKHPLDGVTVIDFGHYLAGPFGTMLMADLGARVIKVEPVEGERMRMPSQPFMGCQRGKWDIALDLKKPEALELAYRLVEKADMVHHNHRPGVAERLQIDYDHIKQINPNIVYVHSPAYGVRGPDAMMGGYDQLFQANSGLEYMGGGEGNPPIWYKVAAVDHGGALSSAVGGLLALYHRERTGEGQFVDSSLLNAGLFYNSDAFLCDDPRPQRRPTLDKGQHGLSADYRLYKCKDDHWICIAALFDREWESFCHVLGVSGLAEDPRYKSHRDRIDHRDQLGGLLEPIFMTKTSVDWAAAFDKSGVPAELCIADYWLQFLKDPWMMQTRRVVKYHQPDLGGELWQFGEVIRFSETPQIIQGPPPTIGQHSRELLTELGVSEQRQVELRAAGVTIWPDR